MKVLIGEYLLCINLNLIEYFSYFCISDIEFCNQAWSLLCNLNKSSFSIFLWWFRKLFNRQFDYFWFWQSRRKISFVFFSWVFIPGIKRNLRPEQTLFCLILLWNNLICFLFFKYTLSILMQSFMNRGNVRLLISFCQSKLDWLWAYKWFVIKA